MRSDSANYGPRLSDQWLGGRIRSIPAPSRGTGSALELYPKALLSVDAKQLFSVTVRTAIEIVKFLPEYRDRWTRLAKCYPDEAVYDGLKRMRAAKPAAPTALHAALLHLASFPLLGLLGPVDPTKESDFPPLRAWHPEPPHGWLTHFLGIDEVMNPSWGERSRGMGGRMTWPGWSAELEVDLRYPNSVLSVAMDMVREDRKRTAPPNALRLWQAQEPLHQTLWDGPRGWRASFWLLRQQQRGRRRDINDLADGYMRILREWGLPADKSVKNPKRQAKRRSRTQVPTSISDAKRDIPHLLERARRRVREAQRDLELDATWISKWDALLSKCRTGKS